MKRSLLLLDELYASELGCSPEDFNSGRLITVQHDQICQIRFAKGVPLALFSIARETSTVICVRSPLKNIVDSALHGVTALDEKACELLESAFGAVVNVSFWFRGCRLYCEPDTFVDQGIGDVRNVTGLDETSKTLHAKWGGPVFGQIVDGETVAYAAVKPLSDVAWDLSVQTLPEHRGRGYAKSVVSAATRHIFENDKLATWGTDRTNTASLRTAHSLGFQDYGLDLGCVERHIGEVH